MKRATKKKQVAELGRRHIYRFYRKYLTKRNSEHNILNESTYTKVLNDFNKEIRRKIIEEAFEFIMPLIGQLGIRKIKPKRVFDDKGNLSRKHMPSINWELSKKYHKRIYHTNQHTEGYKYNIQYSSYRCILPNKHFFKFIACRTMKRMLAKTIKDPAFNGDYYENHI